MGEVIQFRGRTNRMDDEAPYTDSRVYLDLACPGGVTEHLNDIKSFVLYGVDRETDESVLATKCDVPLLIEGSSHILKSIKQMRFSSNEQQHIKDQLQHLKLTIDEIMLDMGGWYNGVCGTVSKET